MTVKTVSRLLDDANAVVPRVSAADALAWLDDDNTVLLDVRPAAALLEGGTVEGALHIPRGLLEFQVDPEFEMYNPAIAPSMRVVVFCALGGQAALAGKTLKEMGYDQVYNGGALSDWQAAGARIVHPMG